MLGAVIEVHSKYYGITGQGVINSVKLQRMGDVGGGLAS